MHDQVSERTKDRGAARNTLGRKVLWRLALIGAVAIGVAFVGISSREHEERDLARLTQDAAVPTVEVVNPERGTGRSTLFCPVRCRRGSARRSTHASAATSKCGTRISVQR